MKHYVKFWRLGRGAIYCALLLGVMNHAPTIWVMKPSLVLLVGGIIWGTIGHQSHAWENPEVRRMGLIMFIWPFDVHLFQASGTVKPEEPKMTGIHVRCYP